MMRGKMIEELKRDSEEMRLYQQEWLILEVTEHISKVMEKKSIKKKELAERLGRSKGYITQLLDGRANMTLRTVADVMWALDCSLSVDVRPLDFETNIESSDALPQPAGVDLWSLYDEFEVPVCLQDYVESERSAA